MSLLGAELLGFAAPLVLSNKFRNAFFSRRIHSKKSIPQKRTSQTHHTITLASKEPSLSTTVPTASPSIPAFQTVPYPSSLPTPTINPQYPTVIIPGYGADASQYKNLQQTLSSLTEGHVSVVPIRWYDWGRTLGGRPVNLILDLVEDEIRRVVGEDGLISEKTKMVNIVGHSAGGWVARIWMGDEVYEGGTWGAKGRVASLVCLGTPHTSTEAVTKRNMGFVNGVYPGCWVKDVKYVCIGGLGCRVEEQGWWKVWSKEWFAKVSYQMTAGKGVLEGDGVVPVDAAVLEGAENIMIEGVWHSPSSPGPWYGEPEVAQFWAQFLL